MHKNSTKASLFDLPTTTANPCPSENPCNRALHVAVDSRTSLVVGNLRKAGGKLAMAWLNVLCLGGMRRCVMVPPEWFPSLYVSCKQKIKLGGFGNTVASPLGRSPPLRSYCASQSAPLHPQKQDTPWSSVETGGAFIDYSSC